MHAAMWLAIYSSYAYELALNPVTIHVASLSHRYGGSILASYVQLWMQPRMQLLKVP